MTGGISAGEKFGKLVALSYAGTRARRSVYWLCRCKCGAEKEVRASHLRSGATKSCGCLRATHRQSQKAPGRPGKTPEYAAWNGMKERCSNPNGKDYDKYGARGICVCDRWSTSFENFFEDMGCRPSRGYSLDRVDVNGNYEPGNCRWATYSEQNNNRRKRTHCLRGHELTEENIYRIIDVTMKEGFSRLCRRCRLDSMTRRRKLKSRQP